MTLRDVSILVAPGTPEWPGDTPYACGWSWRIAEGASVNVSTLTTSPHVGTHADAPVHVRDGWPAIDALPLDAFHGRALLLDVGAEEARIGFERLAPRLPHRVERLLLRTGRTIAGGVFPAAWPVLAEECVPRLLERGLRLLGVDAPSVDDRESKTLSVHRLLFEGHACVLENLDLRDVPEGEYELTAYPLRLAGLDAAPVRAVLRDYPGQRTRPPEP